MSRKRTEKLIFSNETFNRLQVKLILFYIVVSFIVILISSLFTYFESRRAATEKISELISADSRQLELNINSYLKSVERNAALLFSDEAYYAYDATDKSLTDYEKIKAEENIENRIIDFGLMENYSDFGIIYSNDETVGWISSTTSDLFPDGGLYRTFSSYIKNNDTYDAWCFDVKGNRDRCYYVKRLNPNAILVASFFSRELDAVFELPDSLHNMIVRFADSDHKIIFSSESKEIGKTLPEELQKMTPTDSVTDETKNLLIDENVCTNGWVVYTSVSKDAVMNKITSVLVYTLIFIFVISAAMGIIGTLIIQHVTNSVGNIVGSLEERASVDKLSGKLNKSAFQEYVVRMLSDEKDVIPVFIMIDIDNFKNINDMLGHKYGDEIISRFGKFLGESLGKQYEIGRIGGDEFAAYIEFTDDRENIMELVENDIKIMMNTFCREFNEECKKCSISFSTGIYFGKSNDETFEHMYEKADMALYKAKRGGKNQFVTYED